LGVIFTGKDYTGKAWVVKSASERQLRLGRVNVIVLGGGELTLG
jgi:hypothetical protein